MLVTTPWMHDRAATGSASHAGSGHRASTPRRSPRQLRDTVAARPLGPRPRSVDGPRVVVGYVGSLHRRHGVRRLPELAGSPASGRSSSATARSAAGSRTGCPTRSSPAPLETGDLTRALASLDVAGPPGRARRPAATCCARRRPAVCPVVAPRAGGAHATWYGTWRPGLLYDPADRARPAPRRGRARRRTGTVPCSAGGPGAGAGSRDWRTAVDELVARALPARAAGAGRTQPDPGNRAAEMSHSPAGVGRRAGR